MNVGKVSGVVRWYKSISLGVNVYHLVKYITW